MWLLLHKQFYHVFSGWFFVSLLFTKEFTKGLGIAPSSLLQFSSNFFLCIFNETQIIITCIKFTLDITITGKYVWNTKQGTASNWNVLGEFFILHKMNGKFSLTMIYIFEILGFFFWCSIMLEIEFFTFFRTNSELNFQWPWT